MNRITRNSGGGGGGATPTFRPNGVRTRRHVLRGFHWGT